MLEVKCKGASSSANKYDVQVQRSNFSERDYFFNPWAPCPEIGRCMHNWRAPRASNILTYKKSP